MGHDSLTNFIRSNFNLFQHHKWSLNDIENMMPWERHIYVELLNMFVRQEEDKARQRENEQKNMMAHLNRRRM